MTEEEAKRDRVCAYVQGVLNIVTGIPVDEAATALTLTVAALMICWSEDSKKARLDMGRNFAGQLYEYLNNEEIVNWIKESAIWVQTSDKMQ